MLGMTREVIQARIASDDEFVKSMAASAASDKGGGYKIKLNKQLKLIIDRQARQRTNP